MSSGRFGSVVASTVGINDVEILYIYQASRESEPTSISSLEPNDVLSNLNEIQNPTEIMSGLHKLRLPKDVFNKEGIYTLVIRPKRIKCTITDCGSLSSVATVKGIILSANDQNLVQNIPNALSSNGLAGYRIEYIDSTSNSLIKNFFTIITSSNKCEAINQNQSNTTSKSITYRFNDSGSLLFLTVTPSSSSQVLPNRKPFIGSSGQQVYLINTFFDPIMIELNFTKYNIESVIKYIAGPKTHNFENGKVTIFNDDADKTIYDQLIEYTIKDTISNSTLYTVVERTDTIDTSENFDDITQNINNI